jgi:transcriptional regulator with XRE-family HTH domain
MNQDEKKLREEFFEKAGEFLKTKRVENELSLRDVAEKVGCKAQFICNIERGKAFPPPGVMKGMVEAYRIPPRELVEFLVDAQGSYYQNLYFGAKRRRRSNRLN